MGEISRLISRRVALIDEAPADPFTVGCRELHSLQRWFWPARSRSSQRFPAEPGLTLAGKEEEAAIEPVLHDPWRTLTALVWEKDIARYESQSVHLLLDHLIHVSHVISMSLTYLMKQVQGVYVTSQTTSLNLYHALEPAPKPPLTNVIHSC